MTVTPDRQVDCAKRGDPDTHWRSASQYLGEENEGSVEHVSLKEERGQKGNVPGDTPGGGFCTKSNR